VNPFDWQALVGLDAEVEQGDHNHGCKDRIIAADAGEKPDQASGDLGFVAGLEFGEERGNDRIADRQSAGDVPKTSRFSGFVPLAIVTHHMVSDNLAFAASLGVAADRLHGHADRVPCTIRHSHSSLACLKPGKSALATVMGNDLAS